MRALRERQRWRPERGVRARVLNSEGTRYADAYDDEIVVRATTTQQPLGLHKLKAPSEWHGLSDDGARLAVVYDAQDFVISDVGSGSIVWRSTQVPCGGPQVFSLNRSARSEARLVATSPDRRVALVRAGAVDHLCHLGVRQSPQLLPFTSGMSFTPDSRRIPIVRDGGDVQLWSWEDDVFDPPMRSRDVNVRSSRVDGRWRHWDPTRQRLLNRASWPHKAYSRVVRAFAVCHGRPLLAWFRDEMIEVGLLDAPDCTSLLLERSFGWRDISIDYTGELVAVVGGRALLLVDLPRRRISRCPSDEDLRGVAFAPDGTLYSRSLDNALLAYETIWV